VGIGDAVDRDGESGIPKTIGDIRAVPPDMITLPEDTKPLVRINNGRIFERLVLRHGNNDQRPAIGGEDAMQLLHRPSVVRHVLEDMAADDGVERLVRELDIGHIQVQIDIFSFEIGGSIAGTQTLAEDGLEAALGCKVQDVLGAAVEEIGVVVQEKPHKPMAFQGSTVNALGFGTGRIPVGTEPSG
jgi:hypothetical protein